MNGGRLLKIIQYLDMPYTKGNNTKDEYVSIAVFKIVAVDSQENHTLLSRGI